MSLRLSRIHAGCKVQRSYDRPAGVGQEPAGEEAGPQGLAVLTLHAITHHSETASGYEGKVAAEMIGAKFEESSQWAWNPLRDHVAKTTTRPEFGLIALICAGYEKTIQKDSWRSPSQTHRDYLNQLVAWGYVDRTKSNSFWTANG